MAQRVTKFSRGKPVNSEQLPKGGLANLLEKTGRLPPIALTIAPLDGTPNFALDKFLTYRFASSIIKPVDQFDFSFVAPDDPRSFNQYIKEGDIATLSTNGVGLSVGILDQTEISVDREDGEKVHISGRDLMSQLEDQDAISINDSPIWANAYTVKQAITKLNESTRISNDIVLQDAPSGGYLFATEPGEKKLSALQRFLEPLNCLAWMNGDGRMVVGRPNMAQAPKGTLFLSKKDRRSNVLSMKVNRSATQIPNIIVPIWSGQEYVQERIGPSQRLLNASRGPDRLRRLGHLVPKAVVVSTPNGTDAQGLADVNAIANAGNATILQAYAKREVARQNIQEMVVEVVVPGHFNELGEPYLIDTVYKIFFDRGDVDENMYLMEVEYSGGDSIGQQSRLTFCRLGRIVSDIRVP